MSYSHRIFIYGPVLLLALVAGFYGLYWKVAADTLSARLDRANGGELVPGISFAFAGKSVGGFPFRLDIVLDGVTFAHKTTTGETAWRTEKLAIHALSYGTGRFVFEATGLQSVERPGETGGPPKVLYLTPAITRASAILTGGQLVRADLDLWGVQAKDASLNAGADRVFTAARAQFHLLATTDRKIAVAVKIDDAKIGQGYAPQLGPDMTLLTAQGTIDPSDAFDGVRTGTVSLADALDSWRQRNGAIDLSAFTLRWSGVNVAAKGKLGLDANDQLAGALQGTLTGGAAFVDAITHNADPAAQAQARALYQALAVKEPIAGQLVFADGAMRVAPDAIAAP